MSSHTPEATQQKLETDHLLRTSESWQIKDKAREAINTVFSMSPFAGHKIFHAICQSSYKVDFGSEAAAMGLDPLEKMGFIHMPRVLNLEAIAELKDMVEFCKANEAKDLREFRQQVSQKLVTDWGIDEHVQNMIIPLEQLQRIFELSSKITKGPLGRLVQAHFQSYFQIANCLLYRTTPTNNPRVSFEWHRDLAPDSQVHLMLFLQDGKADGSGGMIEFLPRAQSDLLEKNFKYGFRDPGDRVTDLRTLGVPEEVVKSIYRPNIKAGDGILFRASKILHKGIAPQSGVRDVLSFVFLPATNPWMDKATPELIEKWRIRVNGFDTLKAHPLEL